VSQRPVARRAHWAALLGLGALLVLAGCAPQPRRAEMPADWQAHAAAVGALEAWQLQGKIGVRAASGSGSAFLTWKQEAASYRLVLSGALGMGKLVLTGDADGVAWNDSRGRTGRHADPDALVAEIWGWQLPVAALKYWIRGIPQPGRAVEDAEFAGAEVTRFRQSGWLVEPGAYREVDGLALPTRLRLEGEGAVLTLLINRWGPPAP
jgi:outer membrane lipoprotein LolB